MFEFSSDEVAGCTSYKWKIKFILCFIVRRKFSEKRHLAKRMRAFFGQHESSLFVARGCDDANHSKHFNKLHANRRRRCRLTETDRNKIKMHILYTKAFCSVVRSRTDKMRNHFAGISSRNFSLDLLKFSAGK